MPDDGSKEPKHVAYYLCINTNTIIINIIVSLTGSKLCFTINRLWQYKFPLYWFVCRCQTHDPYRTIRYTIHTLMYFHLLTYLLTYSMVQSPSWAADWLAASQEIPRIYVIFLVTCWLTKSLHLQLFSYHHILNFRDLSISTRNVSSLSWLVYATWFILLLCFVSILMGYNIL